MKKIISFIICTLPFLFSCEYENTFVPAGNNIDINYGDTIIISGKGFDIIDFLYPDGFIGLEYVELDFSKAGTEYIVPKGKNFYCQIHTQNFLSFNNNPSIDTLFWGWQINSYHCFFQINHIDKRFYEAKKAFIFTEGTKIKKLYNDSISRKKESLQIGHQQSLVYGYLVNSKVEPIIINLEHNNYTVPDGKYFISPFHYDTQIYYREDANTPFNYKDLYVFDRVENVCEVNDNSLPVSYFRAMDLGYIFPPGTVLSKKSYAKDHAFYFLKPYLINGYLRGIE